MVTLRSQIHLSFAMNNFLQVKNASDLYSKAHVARPMFNADPTSVEHVSCHVKWHSDISFRLLKKTRVRFVRSPDLTWVSSDAKFHIIYACVSRTEKSSSNYLDSHASIWIFLLVLDVYLGSHSTYTRNMVISVLFRVRRVRVQLVLNYKSRYRYSREKSDFRDTLYSQKNKATRLW